MQSSSFKDVYNEVQNAVVSEEFTVTKEENNLSGVYVFISIDLVNSTIFKTRYTQYWPFVIQTFYDIVTNALGAEFTYRGTSPIKYIGKKEDFENEKMKTGGFKVWKLVGDEVLLYHKIVSVSELLNTIRIMDWVTNYIIELFISKGEVFFEKDSDHLNEFVRIAKRHLAAKTTMWAAYCGKQITLDSPNMYYDSSNYLESTGTYLDFLGPDIDAGFRLCKYAEKNKLIISPELMALLTIQIEANERAELAGEIEENFRIVTYVVLEDIWEKRLYPVFMYCSRKKLKNEDKSLRWRKMFEYDEVETSRLARYIFNDSYFLDNDEYSYKQLDTIYRDLGQYEEISELKKKFQDQIEVLGSIRNTISQENKKFEFHISCLCYDPRKKKIWIDNHKNHGWSFGCIKISMNHDYYQKVRQAYLKKYKIEIDFSSKSEFLSFYSVNRKNGIEEVLGIIFLVSAKPVNGAKSVKDQGWYSIESIKKEATKTKRINEFDDVIGMVEKRIEAG